MGQSRSESKLMTAREAISRFAADGETVYVGYLMVPHALCHEVIRQRKRGLTLVGASLLQQATLLILAGCVGRLMTGYLGGALRSKLLRDLMARGELKYEDYSNQSQTLMLMAGALGIPFIPTRTFLGSDFLSDKCVNHPHGWLRDKKYQLSQCPFTREKVVLLPALRPDLAVMAAQRADSQGNVQAWGALGDAKWALWAARKVVVSVEEVVPTEVIRRDPNRTIIPSFKVSAVVHEPFGAHPGAMSGYYDIDLAFNGRYGAWDSDEGASRQFLEEWVYGVKDRREYIERYVAKLGYEALRSIQASPPFPPIGTVDYAYSPNITAGVMRL